jgi:putative transposase
LQANHLFGVPTLTNHPLLTRRPRTASPLGWTLQVIKRLPGTKGFVLLPGRWIIKRTFGWLGRYRRLARDFEHTPASIQAFIYIASSRRMLKILAQ